MSWFDEAHHDRKGALVVKVYCNCKVERVDVTSFITNVIPNAERYLPRLAICLIGALVMLSATSQYLRRSLSSLRFVRDDGMLWAVTGKWSG